MSNESSPRDPAAEGTSTPRTSMGAGPAACSAPALMGATDKAGARPPVLGRGEHTYEVVPGWCKLPNGVRFGDTHGVAEDAQGRIFIHNQSRHAVAIFDAEGKFITSWGEQFEKGAHGMTLHKEGAAEFLYLCDYEQHKVFKTTLDGDILMVLGTPPLEDVYPDDGAYRPTNCAVAPNGDIYVADGYGQSWIHQYHKTGEYIDSWGGEGAEPGRMKCPHGIWIDDRSGQPLLVVADRANVRLQYFTLDGRHIGFVCDNLRHPCHFRIRGTDLLVPDLHGRVTILDRDNKLITHLGIDSNAAHWTEPEGYPNVPHDKRVVGKFIAPHDACWDREGNIYVVEWVPDGRVTKLRRVDA